MNKKIKNKNLKRSPQNNSKINFKDENIIDLALAMLYLGKDLNIKNRYGKFRSSILKFFLKIMLNLYHLDINKIRFNLHLRADQNPKTIKNFGQMN